MFESKSMKINKQLLYSLLISVSIIGCANKLEKKELNCAEGRTVLDGVCVKEVIADYVSCVRAQGAQLNTEEVKSLSAGVGYFSIKANVQGNTSGKIEKKYQVPNEAMNSIIENCNRMSGFQSNVSTSAPIVETKLNSPTPIYSSYYIRAKFSSILSYINSPKMSMAIYIQQTGKLPNKLEDIDFPMDDILQLGEVDQIFLTKAKGLGLKLSKEFGDNKFISMTPRITSGGGFIMWRCETNIDLRKNNYSMCNYNDNLDIQ